MTNTAFVAMGTNMPFDGVSGAALLRRAVAAIEAADIAVVARSSVWRTAPWPPGADQPDYFNAVIAVDAGARTPAALYTELAAIERAFGRLRRDKWEPRTLDLDIVAMEGLAGDFGGVVLPHPRMQERSFVLAPLAEVAADWRHPETGRSAAEMLAALAGEGYRRVDALAEPGGG